MNVQVRSSVYTTSAAAAAAAAVTASSSDVNKTTTKTMTTTTKGGSHCKHGPARRRRDVPPSLAVKGERAGCAADRPTPSNERTTEIFINSSRRPADRQVVKVRPSVATTYAIIRFRSGGGGGGSSIVTDRRRTDAAAAAASSRCAE